MLKFENTVKELSSYLDKPDINVIDWAVVQAIPRVALRSEDNMTVCAKCDNRTPYAGNEKKIRCLGCGTELDVIDVAEMRKQRLPFSFLFCMTECFGDILLIRTIQIKGELHFKDGCVRFSYQEICRHWISAAGETAVQAIPAFWGKLIRYGKLKLRTSNRILYDSYCDIAEVWPESKLPDPFNEMRKKQNKSLPQKSMYSFIIQLMEDDMNMREIL